MSDVAISGSADSYGLLERCLHRVAFAHPLVQRVLADIEGDLFRRELSGVSIAQPVFITGLPRAGTTLLLELLHGCAEFATFTYRQMPFVLSPLLWQRISERGRKEGGLRERAHGDAMMIGHDSPEAFDEVLWLNHLSKRLVDGPSMRTLDATAIDPAFSRAYRALAAAVIATDKRSRGMASIPMDGSARYLSKNNAIIGRLPAIHAVFDNATTLVCFRHPSTHIASLQRQHARFTAMHDDDAFSQRYMAWIGHHDFGRNFRPIRFDESNPLSPGTPDFWWQYWTDAYCHALNTATPGTRFVCYESLLRIGRDTLTRLGDSLALACPHRLVDAAATLRQPTTRIEADGSEVSSALKERAYATYDTLLKRAL